MLRRMILWRERLIAAGLVLAALGIWNCPQVSAAPLILNAGSITIDTDTLTLSGAVSATGSLSGNVAVFSFDQISLGSGVSVTLQGSRPLSLRSSGDIVINTTLNAAGAQGVNNTAVSGAAGWGGVGILGGGDGGRAGQGTGVPGTNGLGLGGGGGQRSCCGGGSGGGFGGVGGYPRTDTAHATPVGAVYGDPQLSVLQGGSGGGGGAGNHDCCYSGGGGGGAGGGAIELLSEKGYVTIGPTGQILVPGGNGGGASRQGGGGSGGAIRIDAARGITIYKPSLLDATGGISSLTSDRGGGGGGGGRIYLEGTNILIGGAVPGWGPASSGGQVSVLGGPGSANPAGGIAGADGTILFQQRVHPWEATHTFVQGGVTPVVGGIYTGAQDANILSQFPNENVGIRADMEVGHNGVNSVIREVMRFEDLDVLQGRKIMAARLELTVHSVRSGAGANTIEAFGILPAVGDWVEGSLATGVSGTPDANDRGVTWNRRNQTNHNPLEGPLWNTPGLGAGTDYDPTALGSFSVVGSGPGGESQYDIVSLNFNSAGLELIQSWVDGGPNAGFLLKAANESTPSVIYFSSQAASLGYRPRLILTVPEPGSALLLLLGAAALLLWRRR